MGKVSKRLTIVVFPPLDTWPEIVKLEKQGHTIVRGTAEGFHKYSEIAPMTEGESTVSNLFKEADIILGPRCWYMTGLHRKHLTQALKQARLRKYGTISKRGKGDEKDEDITSIDPEPGGC